MLFLRPVLPGCWSPVAKFWESFFKSDYSTSFKGSQQCGLSLPIDYYVKHLYSMNIWLPGFNSDGRFCELYLESLLFIMIQVQSISVILCQLWLLHSSNLLTVWWSQGNSLIDTGSSLRLEDFKIGCCSILVVHSQQELNNNSRLTLPV